MGFKKRVMTAALVVIMAMSMVLNVFAATKSPGSGEDTKVPNPGYNVKSQVDTNTQDHLSKIVKTKITSKNSTAFTVLSVQGLKNADSIELKVCRTASNKQIPIGYIGDGVNGMFDSQRGRIVTKVFISTQARRPTIAGNCFKNSNVSKITISTKKLLIRANAFKGTRVKNPTIIISGPTKTADAFGFFKGAFNGLSSNAKIVVSRKTMTNKEFKRLKYKLQYFGFKGKIVQG